ncbi:MAG: hypothetical protein COA40_10605 [Aequorivita sp.]|nr:MAG: hypothetical protein COA40_10605 [Aequorivita sp.]
MLCYALFNYKLFKHLFINLLKYSNQKTVIIILQKKIKKRVKILLEPFIHLDYFHLTGNNPNN